MGRRRSRAKTVGRERPTPDATVTIAQSADEFNAELDKIKRGHGKDWDFAWKEFLSSKANRVWWDGIGAEGGLHYRGGHEASAVLGKLACYLGPDSVDGSARVSVPKAVAQWWKLAGDALIEPFDHRQGGAYYVAKTYGPGGRGELDFGGDWSDNNSHKLSGVSLARHSFATV